jgi:hypothetical protein
VAPSCRGGASLGRARAAPHALTLWLIQIGASPDLVRAGLRIAGDEIVHAEMSHRVFLAAGGQGSPHLVRETLSLQRDDGASLESDVTAAAVEIFCLGETVAVPLFKELRERCSVPIARRTLDRVLKDEVRHRDFGWTLLEWLMSHSSAGELRALVVRELPRYFARLRAAYAPAESGVPPTTDAERAWGLMPVSLYRASLQKAAVRDWIPRFERLGFDARAAWDGSKAPDSGGPLRQ